MFVTVFFAIKVWNLTKFRTRDGGSPTKDGSPIKKTTTTRDQNKEIFNERSGVRNLPPPCCVLEQDTLLPESTG